MFPEAGAAPPAGWCAARPGEGDLDRVRIEALPTAYRPDQFAWSFLGTRRRIARLIDEAQYLNFAIGGLFGDWGAVACLVARARRRPYAVWTDRVESEVVRRSARSGPVRERLRASLYHRPMAMLERLVIRRASLGLFHGRSTFEAYAPYCRQPQVVHDIHISLQDHIPRELLCRKLETARCGPLKIIYVGRAHPMKGPLDWLSVLSGVHARGVDFQASWLGDGPELTAMRSKLDRLEIRNKVVLSGFVSSRERILSALREAHIFLFCHKTPESPRSPIEALISGAVLVGYDGAFVRDITQINKSGLFHPIDDIFSTIESIAELAKNREMLSDQIKKAKKDGEYFHDIGVFRHRSDLIREFLPY